MRLFNFTVSNCRNCNKCVRVCPVKAIRFINNEAKIDETRCIACGQCFMACPKHARNVQNDVDKVLRELDSGKKTVAILDSAYMGAFKEPEKFISALRTLGFSSVQEIAAASEKVTELYINYMNENAGKQKYFISSTCPAIYIFIEKYHHELIKYLMPVASPMVLLGRAIKKDDPDCTAVYIGPCLSKKYETYPKEGAEVDAHITFVEILKMFRKKGIYIDDMEPSVPDVVPALSGENYSIAGDMWPSLTETVEKHGYDILRVNGMDNVKQLFESMENETLGDCYIGISACTESCINGPFIPYDANGLFCRRQKIKAFAEKGGWGEKGRNVNWDGVDYSYKFTKMLVPLKMPSEEEITQILRKMGRKSRAEEFDCGACGYNTCREKAVAIYGGMASIDMCWPYLREKAKRRGDLFFRNSRNILFLLDKNLNILQINPVGERKLGFKTEEAMGKPVDIFNSGRDIYQQSLDIKNDIINVKMHLRDKKMVVMTNIVYIEGDEVFVSMQDITSEEQRKEELAKLKMHTVETAQNVIEKQMRVAQEIASLLGETTAETKVVLNNLKDVVLKEEGE